MKLRNISFAILGLAAILWSQVNSTTGRNYTGNPSAATAIVTGRTTAITTTNLITSVPVNSLYHLDVGLTCTTTSAAATATVTVGWTDVSNTAQTATLASAAACTALGASSYGSLGIVVNAKAGTAITYAAAIVNTPTFDIRVSATQLTGS